MANPERHAIDPATAPADRAAPQDDAAPAGSGQGERTPGDSAPPSPDTTPQGGMSPEVGNLDQDADRAGDGEDTEDHLPGRMGGGLLGG